MESDSDTVIEDQGQSASRFGLVSIDPLRMAKWFACAIFLIVFVGAVVNYALFNLVQDREHPIADVLKRFDLGHEPSLPAFYSSTIMLANAWLLYCLSRFDKSGGLSRRLNWFALSLLFVCLAIDEAVMFHEMATEALDLMDLSGPFYFSWIIPGFLFAAMIGLVFLRFLLSLGPRTGGWLLLSGLVFISGAIGMEFFAGLIFASASSELEALKSPAHVIVQALEEGLEMAGIALFFCALLDYTNRSGLQLAIRDNSNSIELSDA